MARSVCLLFFVALGFVLGVLCFVVEQVKVTNVLLGAELAKHVVAGHHDAEQIKDELLFESAVGFGRRRERRRSVDLNQPGLERRVDDDVKAVALEAVLVRVRFHFATHTFCTVAFLVYVKDRITIYHC